MNRKRLIWDDGQVRDLLEDADHINEMLRALPDTQKYTMSDLDLLESLRHVSLKLTAEVEAILELVNGEPNDK